MAINIWRALLVDRIAITVAVGNKKLYAFAYAGLYGLVEEQSTQLPGGKIRIIKEQYLSRLEYYPEYHSKTNNRRIADITVGANILFGGTSLHRYLTLTLYPSKFQPGDFEHFKWVVDTLLPDFSYSKLYHTSKVNYLELAADSLTHPAHSFLPYRKYAKESDIFKEGVSHLGATILGSLTSNLYFRIYNKAKQLVETGKPTFTPSLPHTRIEAALRRLGVAPANLVQIKNPFLKLQIADIAQAQAASSNEGWQQFIVESLSEGVPSTLSKQAAYQRKKYRSMLDGAQASWWNPATIWTDLEAALTKIAP